MVVVLLAFASALVGCGEDTEECIMNVEKRCLMGIVYWYDSCGRPWDVYEECSCGCDGLSGGCATSCGCTSHSECDSNSICLYGDCVSAYGRRYSITIVSAQISQYDSAGEAWDFPGGMPDPFVCAFKNNEGTGASEFCTTAKQDTYQATYNESFQTDIYEADSWTFVAFDEDVAADDSIGGVIYDPISTVVLKAGGTTWNQGDYLESLTWTIDPLQ